MCYGSDSNINILHNVTFKYFESLEEMVGNSTIVDKTPDPTCRAPSGMPAAAWFLLQFVRAQLATKVKPLEKDRVVEKGYCSTARTVSHVALLELKNGCL